MRHADYLETARRLVQSIESGKAEEAEPLIDELTRIRETDMFQELGKLTRTLHDALNSFRLDSRLAEITEREIPDARERLRYVLAKTDQAAHRTLEAVEGSIPIARSIEEAARAHKERWERFLRREMEVNEFRAMTRSLREFLTSVIDSSAALHKNLSEVRIAQDYQDLTGQVIQRVMTLVEELERSLVDMVRLGCARAKVNGAERSDGTRCEGPQVKGGTRPDVVASQDEVDQLLASLGF